jgi:hypothetical protein
MVCSLLLNDRAYQRHLKRNFIEPSTKNRAIIGIPTSVLRFPNRMCWTKRPDTKSTA